ncbi:MAG: hypothetical protein ACI30J_09005 [Paludibacteraceae bacterium]
MTKTRKFKQSYTSNGVGYQSATSGKGGAYKGGRRGFTQVYTDGTKKGSHGGRLISRLQQYRDIRAGLGLSDG